MRATLFSGCDLMMEYETYDFRTLEAERAENQRLREELVRYGQHLPTCRRLQGSFGDVPDCSCGFESVRAAAAVGK